MTLLKRIFIAVYDEISKPKSFVIGEYFEKYVRKFTFPGDRYNLLNKTHNYHENKRDFVGNSLYPDFQFECMETGKIFYVEVKFRNGVYNDYNKIDWCSPDQLNRYKEINKIHKVFIALGVGDNPNKPDEIFIIPLDEINFCAFYDSFLNKYQFYLNKPVFPSYLWNLTSTKSEK